MARTVWDARHVGGCVESAHVGEHLTGRERGDGSGWRRRVGVEPGAQGRGDGGEIAASFLVRPSRNADEVGADGVGGEAVEAAGSDAREECEGEERDETSEAGEAFGGVEEPRHVARRVDKRSGAVNGGGRHGGERVSGRPSAPDAEREKRGASGAHAVLRDGRAVKTDEPFGGRSIEVGCEAFGVGVEDSYAIAGGGDGGRAAVGGGERGQVVGAGLADGDGDRAFALGGVGARGVGQGRSGREDGEGGEGVGGFGCCERPASGGSGRRRGRNPRLKRLQARQRRRCRFARPPLAAREWVDRHERAAIKRDFCA